jgi:hypothetical protein
LLPFAKIACVTDVGFVEGGKRYLVIEKGFFGLKIPTYPQVVVEQVSTKGVERESFALIDIKN